MYRIYFTRILLVSVSVLLVQPRQGVGAIVYSTGFESPTYTVGGALNGTDGWATPVNPPPAPNLNAGAALVSNAAAFAGIQSIRVLGSDMVASGAATAPYDSVGSYRKALNYDGTNRIVRLQTQIRLNGTPTATPQFSASLAARVGGAQVGEIEIFSNGTTGILGNQPPGSVPNASLSSSLNSWHEFAMDVDFLTRETRFFLNGSSFASTIPFSASSIGNNLERGAFVVYALPNAGSFDLSQYSVEFDNFSVSAVPEPSSFSLAAMPIGAACAGWRKRRLAAQDNNGTNSSGRARALR